MSRAWLTHEKIWARERSRGVGNEQHPASAIALEFKERRRVEYRGLLAQLGVADPDGLATQLMLLPEGAIAAALVRGDPSMALFARDAVVALLRAAGVKISPGAAKLRVSARQAKRVRRAAG